MSRSSDQGGEQLVNLGVLKHHQSAGVTIALKNLSHGLVNQSRRSHISRSTTPAERSSRRWVDLPVIRRKTVLNIIDGVLGAYPRRPGAG